MFLFTLFMICIIEKRKKQTKLAERSCDILAAILDFLTKVHKKPGGVAQLNFNTINRTKVPTFSPSLIKIE